MNTNARVILWGSRIGAVSWLEDQDIAVFQYEPDFIKSGILIAPLTMPLVESPYSFPALAKGTFRGLPGLLADSLPDSYGNAVIDAWLARQGRNASDFNPVERLCYMGSRGMGALEFEPALASPAQNADSLEIASLVALANQILAERSKMTGVFNGKNDQKAIEDILRVGTSAGGARAKAVLAWNPATNEFRSGQIDQGEGFEHWIMKFDGVSDSAFEALADAGGYGKIEYAYYLIAKDAGIEMSKCRLHQEGGRSHFMTKRFDRTADSDKLHLQSLGALAHFDYKQPAGYSYEQAIQVIRRLKLTREDMEQMLLRAIFNVVGRNNDDHVKNIAFLMNRKGEWKLAPAYDMIYAQNPVGAWTSRHQMSINGKRENIVRDDLIALADFADIKKRKAGQMIDKVILSFSKWREFAQKTGIAEERILKIQKNLIIDL